MSSNEIELKKSEKRVENDMKTRRAERGTRKKAESGKAKSGNSGISDLRFHISEKVRMPQAEDAKAISDFEIRKSEDFLTTDGHG